MSFRSPVAVMAISLVAVTVLAACTSSDSADAQEREYFESVRAARALTEENFENFGAIFSQIWPVREALMSALVEAGVGDAFDGTVAALQEITPPVDLETDHELLLAGTTELSQLDQQAADAVKADDLITFSRYNGQLGIVGQRMLGRLSPAYCSSLSEPGEDPASACRSQDPVPGGTYGAELHEELRAFFPAFMLVASVTAFSLSLSPEELAMVIQTDIPEATSLIEDLRERVGALTPPDEFEADHDRLLAFFDALSDLLQQSAIDAFTIRDALMAFGEQIRQLYQGLVNDDFGAIISPLDPPPTDSSG